MTLLVSVISLRSQQQQKQTVMVLEIHFEIRLYVSEIQYFLLADGSPLIV